MKKLLAFRILLVLVMVILPMVAVSPAYAGVGTHHQMIIPVEGPSTWLAEDNPCGFDINAYDSGYIRVNYWTDELGRTVKEIDIWGTRKSMGWVGDNYFKVNLQGPYHFEITYPAENVAVVKISGTGTIVLITLPGSGKVLGGAIHSIETITYDTSNWEHWVQIGYSQDKSVGNASWDEAGFTAFCEYLES